MDAIVATVVDGGRAIVVIYIEGVEINYFLLYFFDYARTLRRRLRPTPCKEALGSGMCSANKTMPLEGKTAPSW
jgi:hypothetical protein